MAPTSFKAVFPPAPTKRSALIKNSLTLSTLLVLGGLVQTVVSFILPPRYALLPVVFLLLRAAVLTAQDTVSSTKYASKLGVIAGRISAQLPRASYDPLRTETASPFGSTPAEKGIVVFNLGARFNHPLGMLAPGAKEFADQFTACNRDLLKRAKELGCLGGTTWHGAQAASNNTILSIYYFRDLDGLNRFAHDPVHRQAWDWFTNVFTKKWGYSHIGIFHEAFCAPAGAYETIYINMPPVLMAAGHASIKNEATGEDEWVPTVVEATGSVWRSQFSRMGKAVGREAKA
ncbi:70390458-6cd9-4bca-bc76-820d412bafce [Thermothielavioides terrestris]|uniref:70390458-6cd9-4bca-bc76-820d412bafce n=1 Tax=Thermothielavioides terrestris TaxID=2587410 RepID=A0A3S4F3J5_9PEZI|nr:70390458-6cd9-4bca-bc76-820d412bafce [Thermothielavioides terrestris]